MVLKRQSMGQGQPGRKLWVLTRLAAVALSLVCAGAAAVGCSAHGESVQVDATVRISVCDGDVCTFAPVPGAHVQLRIAGVVVTEGLTDENGAVELTSEESGDGIVTAEWGSLRSESIVTLESPSTVTLAFAEQAVVH